MFSCFRLILLLAAVPVVWSLYERFQHLMPSYTRPPQDFYELLNDVLMERAYDNMLVVHQNNAVTMETKELLQLPLPKVLMTTGYEFAIHTKFNSEVLVLVIMSLEMDSKLMQTAADSLNYMRQTKIIVIIFNALHLEDFKEELLQLSEMYHMTNILLYISFDHERAPQLFQLKPYPSYYWLVLAWPSKDTTTLFPLHWLNMHNKTLITYTDQVIPRAFFFRDSKGMLQWDGHLARMVLLFAEHFNASLQMYRPLQRNRTVHYSVLLNLTKEGKLDLPMVTETGYELANSSAIFELGKGMLMVPCAVRKSTQEIFALLMDMNFIICVIVCSVVLTTAHSLIDYYYLKVNVHWNCIIHDHVLPGVLGQSFAVRSSRLSTLRIVYFLIGFAGINIAALFSGHLNTLLTIPPHHRQIASFADLTQSPLKILLEAQLANSGTWGEFLMESLKPIQNSITFTTNISQVLESRYNFNTSYGYYVPSSLWKLYAKRQQFFTEKIFCTSQGLVVFDHMPWGLRLQYNSPYRDAMNYLIHRVHELGLIEAWHSSTFEDMLQLKLATIRDPNPAEVWQILNAYDLLWVWMIVVVGLACSVLVLLGEVCTEKGKRMLKLM